MPDVYEARAGFEKYDVRFIKRPDNGCMKGLAFIKDPDGYWIEILAAEGIAEIIRWQSLDDINSQPHITKVALSQVPMTIEIIR